MPWLFKSTKGYFQYVPPAFITLLTVIGQLSFSMLENYESLIACVDTAMVTEIKLARFLLRK